MKVILHGATNSSNFGDFLFADLFYQKVVECNKNGETIFFESPKFGLGKFFRKELGYTHKQTYRDLLGADALVYISGGYFGERTTSLKESVKRLLRYLPIGLLFIIRRKPILILGVGGGPISNRFLRISFSFLMNKAAVVSVRDEKTANYFKSYGVKKEIKVTSDTAQVISENSLPTLDLNIKLQLENVFANKKIIFLHALSGEKVNNLYSEKIIPALNKFLDRHDEYGVIIGYDEVYSKSVDKLSLKNELTSKFVYCYDYQKPWQLSSLLKEVDVIITPKLHVGIVGATLSKSVLSFPIHSEKTKRYYEQIAEADRCISLNEINALTIESMLENYHDKKIELSQKIVTSANENLNLLEKAIMNLK
ncbi:polysaccharide pyruvyl transferase family protein [Paenibacillus sp. BC26]|uniref:polysaccharide pyruvyl transferase family protein n=1 Tax=Paenibacillus sp. BC26 TaxID=1881032 RepID=UPI0008E05328|nr:polysaccharide pyruvyl transferase family protein [Paenibacillus sp. BC26]SFT25344.1 Polysaccharide pyruvyl transferase family protein WcaK [Paenibacillus sp. BC26]